MLWLSEGEVASTFKGKCLWGGGATALGSEDYKENSEMKSAENNKNNYDLFEDFIFH